MVEVKRPAVDTTDAPPAKRPSGGSGALEEDLEAELDAEQDQQAEEDVDAIMFDDDIELHLGEAGRNWTRPEPKPHEPRKDKLGALALTTQKYMLCYNAQQDLKQCRPGDACSVSAAGGGLHHWSSQQGCPFDRSC